MKAFVTSFLVVFSLAATSQPQLLPSIGISTEPGSSDLICTIPEYLSDYNSSGIQVGDTCADFTLYNTFGNSFNLQATLASGKPVLMISGSYTCPVFRNKIATINEVIQDYGDILEVIVIYGVEAHPFGDISPYFGYENPGQANLNQGILFSQPTTYAERLAIGDSLFANTAINPDIVYFEAPCQNWWDFYGPAPQNSYLIDTTGVVYSKHGWFHKHPENIFCDIQQYFGLPEMDCSQTLNGTFELYHTDTIEYGIAGDILYPGTGLRNSSQEDVLVEVRRLMVDVPNDWETSMCVTACLPVDQSIDTVLILAGETQLFTIDFHTGLVPDDGRVRMRFRNTSDPQNQYLQAFYAYTSQVGISENEKLELKVYPNPTSDFVQIQLPIEAQSPATTHVYDIHGSLVYSCSFKQNLDVSFLTIGSYIVVVETEDGFFRSVLQKN